MESLGLRLIKSLEGVRRFRNETQEGFADQLGVHRVTYSNWCRNKTKGAADVAVGSLDRFAKVCGRPVHELLALSLPAPPMSAEQVAERAAEIALQKMSEKQSEKSEISRRLARLPANILKEIVLPAIALAEDEAGIPHSLPSRQDAEK